MWLTCALRTASQKLVTQTELNAMIDRYVVENLLPLSTADSDSFRALIDKISGRAGAGQRNTFSKYICSQAAKMTAELKRGKK